MLEYKGYIGHVVYDDEAEIFHGEVINTKDIITFQSDNAHNLKKEFNESVDVYLEFCEDLGKSPEKPFSGKLMIRMPPEVHRSAYLTAKNSGSSLNKWLVDCVKQNIQA